MSPVARLALVAALTAGLSTGSPVGAPQEADPQQAERAYRVARRLIAEGASEARAQLERVVELDPRGELADDARVELARLERLTVWVDELGGVDRAAAARAARALASVEQTPRADRRAEARLLGGLLRLEPVPGHDPAAARLSLLAVSTDPEAGRWWDAARLALAWIHEIDDESARAEGGYLRVLLDAPEPMIEQRAQLGLGRVLLRRGEFGRAATALDRATELGAGPLAERARRGRELAVKRLLGLAPGSAPGAPLLRASVEARASVGLVALAGGGAAIGDRRAESVNVFAADGTLEVARPLSGLQRIGPDAFGGGVAAAAAASLFRLTAEGVWLPLAPLGEFERPAALAIGRDGRAWIVDRKGERLGTLGAGERTIRVVHAGSDLRIAALGLDGARAVVIDRRGGRLLRYEAGGASEPLASVTTDRPLGLDIDASGRIAVLDGRTGNVELLDERGAQGTVALDPEVFTRPSALAFGADGSLHLLDPSASLWGRWP